MREWRPHPWCPGPWRCRRPGAGAAAGRSLEEGEGRARGPGSGRERGRAARGHAAEWKAEVDETRAALAADGDGGRGAGKGTRGAPSGPSRPSLMGMRTGSLESWPGEGGVCCLHASVKVPAVASYEVDTVRCGVPACAYHLRTRGGGGGSGGGSFLNVRASWGCSERRGLRSLAFQAVEARAHGGEGWGLWVGAQRRGRRHRARPGACPAQRAPVQVPAASVPPLAGVARSTHTGPTQVEMPSVHRRIRPCGTLAALFLPLLPPPSVARPP